MKTQPPKPTGTTRRFRKKRSYGPPFLWRVLPPRRKAAPSYLFGTLHLPIVIADVLGPKGMACLDGATTVFTESEALDAETVHEVYRAMAPGMKRSKRGRIARAFLDIPARGESADGPLILDDAIAQRGRGNGQTVRTLESTATRFEILLDHLVETGARPDHVKAACDLAQRNRLVHHPWSRLYRSGDLRQMTTVITAEVQRFPPLVKARDRHAVWLPAVRAALSHGGAFIAAGAAHFMGPRSLRDLLAATGYRIRRVPIPKEVR